MSSRSATSRHFASSLQRRTCRSRWSVEAEAIVGARVARGYGSTECPTAAPGRADDPVDARAETDGRPAAGTELRIVDDEGRDLPVGERGELLVRGPERFVGYLVPPADSGVFDADGWFATGDMASLDAGGRLTIEGRKKDIILRGGEDIASLKAIPTRIRRSPTSRSSRCPIR